MGFARYILLAPIVLGLLSPLLVKIQMYAASESIYQVLSVICHQASSRCFWIAGAPMGICARDVGIYLGVFIATYSSILNRKWRDKIIISFFLMFPLAVEKVALSSFPTTNTIRFVVGILAGFGIGIVFLSVGKSLFSRLNLRALRGGIKL